MSKSSSIGSNMKPDKIFLSDEDELHLQGLVNDKKPCVWTLYGRKFSILCDTLCPVRKMVINAFDALLSAREHEKYEKEYPDEGGG